MSELEAILAELRDIKTKLAALSAKPSPELDIVLTRREAAEQLRVSVRQLQRLIAGGRLVALPSGIARTELERYARTPQVPLPKMMSLPKRERSADQEAERLGELLKTRRLRR